MLSYKKSWQKTADLICSVDQNGCIECIVSICFTFSSAPACWYCLTSRMMQLFLTSQPPMDWFNRGTCQHGHEDLGETAVVVLATCIKLYSRYNLGVTQWFPAKYLGYEKGFLGGQFGNFERLQVPASINSHDSFFFPFCRSERFVRSGTFEFKGPGSLVARALQWHARQCSTLAGSTGCRPGI